jgi:alcohol dehydrogenase, propanol-preferring
MPETMQAYRLVTWGGPPELVEVPVPTPGPGQVVVQVAGNGLCHSDFTMGELPAELGEALGWSMPFTLGHEVGGRIAALGAGVTGLAEGAAVALRSPASCGSCWYCTRGQDSACAAGLVGRGYGRDGGLADYVLVESAGDVLPLRAVDPVLAGPLTDAGATSYHAVKRVLPRLTPGTTAVVIGAGGLGAFAVQFLKALSPVQVVAVDTDPARLEVASARGADHVLAGVDPETVPALLGLSGGGAAAVLDFVGVDATITAGLASVRPAGAYGLIGAGMGGFRRPWYGGLPRDAEIFTFQGSSRSDVEDVLALADDGHLVIDVERYALADVAEAYAALDRGGLRGRVVVVPEG